MATVQLLRAFHHSILAFHMLNDPVPNLHAGLVAAGSWDSLYALKTTIDLVDMRWPSMGRALRNEADAFRRERTVRRALRTENETMRRRIRSLEKRVEEAARKKRANARITKGQRGDGRKRRRSCTTRAKQ